MKTNSDSQDDIPIKMDKTKTDWFQIVAVVFAFLVLLGYATFIHFLVHRVGDGVEAWPRLTYLFTGVEAIVFSAVGFIFGREVNRSRANKAEQSAREADKDKKLAQQKELDALAKAKEEALKGEHLAREILNKAPLAPTGLGISGTRSFSKPNTFIGGEGFSLASTVKQFYPHLEEVQFFSQRSSDFLGEELSSSRPMNPHFNLEKTKQVQEAMKNIPDSPLDAAMGSNFKKPNNP